MARYEEPFEDTLDLFNETINSVGLNQYITITILVDNKLKNLYKPPIKANDLLKYRTGDDVIIIINQNIFDLYEEADKKIIVEEILAGVHYNLEKERVEISKPDVVTFSGIIRKYGIDNWSRITQIARLAIEQSNEN